ncbi:MAG: glucan biosynthesis protein G [Pseudomonadales bacterium]|nr:glucan biosynthesis protein G [Pseudomonadales bacterium]
MSGQGIGRRQFLHGVAAGAFALGAAGGRALDGGGAFSRDTVIALAERLAAAAHVPPEPVPAALARLDYDAYRAIRFRKARAVWGDDATRFSVELFPPGFVFGYGVDLFVVERGRSRPVDLSEGAFEAPTPAIGAALASFGRVSGFRIHYPINRDDYRDEFLVFQGASYFRGVSRGQNYGLSARGLALDVAEATGEEFPIFRAFWIEQPAPDDHAIVVHALLDSPRCTGAYRFAIYPGGRTTLDVDALLFARRPLRHVGLGPLTSMYMHGAADPPVAPDYRPAVHDSLGLAMHTGAGEWLWRPLVNPSRLQLSAFLDANPQGFGLIQRDRAFAAFEDLEARYERRPSAWVAPRGNWGRGQVQLVEIPSDSETNDNIVAYWRPELPIEPGAPFSFAYRLTWPDRAPVTKGLARVLRTARGLAFGSNRPQMAIDFEPIAGARVEDLEVTATLGAGALVERLVVANPETGGVRVFVTFDPRGADLVELRVDVRHEGRAVAETWLYRWLAS